ncbi:uncharacterized protein LOC114645967 [Erpetoichthys calabaricus]|uniref:uncharacterized protein LOC114645967 n=1 Tax=Erpetoichthys calabaricus TaxID=27687 RepID=UPI002234944E|nr:uncharacterized protein LOC114645967 [Erpetoichthys calabaricus]
MRGVRILARKHDDGLFYAAHISQEEQSSKGVFLVQFEKSKRVGEKHKSLLQKTRLCDIVQIDEAARHPIIPGDAVLAPLNLNMKKYGPGIVLLGQERREYRSDAETSEHLVVNFWNGHTANVSAGVAIWIPRQMYDFLVLELQMPPSARVKFLESHPNYPFTVPPGYRPWRDDGDLDKDLFDRSITHIVSPSCPHHSHGQTCDLLGTNIEREMEGSANTGSSLYGLEEKKQGSRLRWQSGSAQNQTRNRKAANKGGKEEQKPKEKKLQKPMQNSLSIQESSMACSERNAAEHQVRKTSTHQCRPQAAAAFFKMPEFPYSCLASRRLAFEGINELLRKDQHAIETIIQKPTIQKRKI